MMQDSTVLKKNNEMVLQSYLPRSVLTHDTPVARVLRNFALAAEPGRSGRNNNIFYSPMACDLKCFHLLLWHYVVKWLLNL